MGFSYYLVNRGDGVFSEVGSVGEEALGEKINSLVLVN